MYASTGTLKVRWVLAKTVETRSAQVRELLCWLRNKRHRRAGAEYRIANVTLSAHVEPAVKAVGLRRRIPW